MSESKLLLDLQGWDTKVTTIKSKLEEAQFKLNDSTEISKAKKLNDLVKEKLHEITLKRNKIEKDIHSLKEKMSSVNTKIYSGLIKTEKGLKALEEEMESLDKNINDQEDQILTIMIDQDRYSDGLKKSSNQILIIEQTKEKEIPKLEKIISELTTELDIASSQSANVRSQCDRLSLLQYDRLIKSHKGIAVSTLTSNLCGACMVSVPTKTIQELKKDNSFVLCNSCQRILCISD